MEVKRIKCFIIKVFAYSLELCGVSGPAEHFLMTACC